MKLTSDAETFLARLAKELRPLSPEEREAVLLELRGHFEERQRQGASHLVAAIEHMGSPAILAQEFIEASAVSMRSVVPSSKGVYLPTVIANSNLPIDYRRRVPLLNLGELLDELRATYAAIGDKWWSVCMFLVAGFTVTSFISTLASIVPEHEALPIWSVYVTRLIVTLIGWGTAYRCILGNDEDLWRLDPPAMRFATASGGLLMLQSVAPVLISQALLHGGLVDDVPPLPFYLQPIVLALTIPAMFAMLRLQPWAVSLIADNEISLLASWRRTEGKGAALMVGWLLVFLPFYVLHLGLAVAAVHVPTGLMIHYGFILSVVDAVTAMMATLASALLNALAYRWVVREPIPAARPFSSTRPTDAQIAETNMRFRRVLAERAIRDIETELQDLGFGRSQMP